MGIVYTCGDYEKGIIEIDYCDSPEEAAQEYVDTGSWGEIESTIWVDVWVRWTDEDGDECEDYFTITVDPEEPACPNHEEHDWQSPYEILGGLKENPGVWGHGGGVIIREVCMHCGCERKTDTWAQNPENGKQGLESVRYEAGKWSEEVAALKEDEDE